MSGVMPCPQVRIRAASGAQAGITYSFYFRNMMGLAYEEAKVSNVCASVMAFGLSPQNTTGQHLAPALP